MTRGQRRVESRSAVWQVLILVTSTSALIWPTMLQLVDKWRPIADNVLGHGWPVVAVALWGLFRDARMITVLQSWQLQWQPLMFTLAISLLWAFAYQAAFGAAQQIFWPFLIGGVIWSALGRPAIRLLSRALFLLIFVVPIWAVFHGFLWKTTTAAVHGVLDVIGLPVEFDGNVIVLPSGRIQIAAGCAGLGFFTAAVSCGAIIGYLNRASWRAQFVLIGVAAAVAMVSNWIRIVIIVIEADRTAMQTSLITESHYTFGWVVFSIGLVTYCLLFGRYGMKDGPRAQPPAPRLLFQAMPLLMALGTAALGPIAVAVTRPVERTTTDSTLTMPQVAPWRALSGGEPCDWQPIYPSADRAVMYQSTAAGQPMFLYANLFLTQSQSKKLISIDNSLLPEGGWQSVSVRRSADSAEMLVTDPIGAYWLVRYVYVVGGVTTANARWSQLSYAWQQFWSDPAAGVVALAVRCTAHCDDASAQNDRAWALGAAPLIQQIHAAGR